MDAFDEEEGPGGGLDLKVLILYAGLRSRGWIVLCVALGSAAALLAAAAQPNIYSSEARLQFSPGMAESLSQEESLGYEDGSRSTPGLEDEILLLTDPRVYEDIARRLTPSWVLRLPDPAGQDDATTSLPVRLMHGLQSWLVQQRRAQQSETIENTSPKALRAAAESLMERITLRGARRSQIMLVTAEAWTPEDAQRILTVALDEFVRRHNEHYGSNYERIEKELAAKREQLEIELEKDRLHKDSCGIEDLESEKERIATELAELSSQARALNAQMISLRATEAQLVPRIASMPDQVEVEEPEQMIVNPRLAILQANIEAEEEYIREITVKNRIRDGVERARKVKEAEERILDLRGQIDVAPPLVSGFPGGVAPTRMVPNDEKVELERQLEEVKLQITSVNGQLDQVDDLRDAAFQSQGKARSCNRIHLQNTSRMVGIEEQIQKLEAQYRAALSIESYRADGESNLRRFTEPDLQLEKTGPKRTKILLAGFFGGAALGCGIALLRQLLDRRVRYRETLEGALGMNVLAVVDEHKGLRKLRSGRSLR